MANANDWEQQPKEGGRVFWDVSGGGRPPRILQGTVVSLDDQFATVRHDLEWSKGNDGWVSTPIVVARTEQVHREYFDVPLGQRLKERAEFWADLADQFGA